MKQDFSMFFLALLGLSSLAQAHTWIEQLSVIGSDGSFVGTPGFARGNVLRSSPTFSDPTMVNLIPPDGRPINEILASDLMCMSSQVNQVQTAGSPRLQAAPGAAVALRYQENGHVTLPQNQPGKPNNRGTVYVYGTTQSSPTDTLLNIHRVWNAAGTGGDGRGVLLSTLNFDDGQCYQVNSGTISLQRQQEFAHPANTLTGADVWCQQDIAIPSNAPSGQPYTLYWVWDWPTLPGTAGFPNGKQEIYTTCMDVDIVSSAGVASFVASDKFSASDVSNAAIQSELGQLSNANVVVGQVIPFNAAGSVATGVAPAAPAATATSAAGQPPAVTVSTGGGMTTLPIPAPGQTTVPQQPNQQTTAPVATQTAGSGGRHSHGGFGNTVATTATIATSVVPAVVSAPTVETALTSQVVATSAAPAGVTESTVASAPAVVTSAPAATASRGHGHDAFTVTEFDDVTETVFQTMFNTSFTRRFVPAPQSVVVAAASPPSPSPSAEATATYRLRGRNFVVGRPVAI